MTDPAMATIDDLLGHEEEPPPAERRPESVPARILKTALSAAALAGLLVLGLRAIEVVVSYWLTFVGMSGLLVLRRVVAEVAPVPLPRARPRPAREESGDYRWNTGDGLRLAVTQWEIRLDWGNTDLPRFTRIMQPAFAEIVDERLRQRHGLTRESDPERARELLGEPLWAILALPVQRPLSPGQVEPLVTRLEQI